MPLPFSFSTQRPSASADSAVNQAAGFEDSHGSSSEYSDGSSERPPGGMVLAFAPVFSAASVFSPAAKPPTPLPPAAAPTPAPVPELAISPRPVTTPAPTGPSTAVMHEASQAPTTGLFAPNGATVMPDVDEGRSELAAQIEQIRNDLFSVATNLSAMSDRLERLESRPSVSAQPHAEIAALRSDFERWIAHHMEPAVEQCLHRIGERSQAANGAASN